MFHVELKLSKTLTQCKLILPEYYRAFNSLLKSMEALA